MRVYCPTSTCYADNDVEAEVCRRCGAALRQYVRLLFYPNQLFNQGLQEARAGNFARARDLFASVVYWCPQDKIAHNALAAACFELKDLAEATRQWEAVLSLSGTDAFAKQGLEAIAALNAAPLPSNEPPPKKDAAKKAPKKSRRVSSILKGKRR